MASTQDNLQEINPDQISPNPVNPRMVFRADELKTLQESIHEVGIRVPLAVYRESPGEQIFVLLDGERRWRCAKKLNLKEVPAIVQPKPTRLGNILMMFNIHNVRVNWDMMPMALKLRDIKDLLSEEGQPTNPKNLTAMTGLSWTTVRRL